MGDPTEAAPYVAYNKIDGKVPTLIGNWVEERTLASRTGIHRLKTVCQDASKPLTSVYPEHVHKQGKTKQDTLPRTLEHDEQYLSAEWLPSSTVAYQPPSDRLGDLITYPSGADVGPREAAELAQLAAVAQTMVPQPPGIERDLSTTYQTNFVQHDASGIQCGPVLLCVVAIISYSAQLSARFCLTSVEVSMTPCSRPHQKIGKVQMKTMDGGSVNRDANFLAETSCLSRAAADRFVHGKRPAAPAQVNLGTDVPITIYSSALGQKRYNAEHYGTRPHGSTSFGKYANFTKLVGDYAKDPSDE